MALFYFIFLATLMYVFVFYYLMIFISHIPETKEIKHYLQFNRVFLYYI